MNRGNPRLDSFVIVGHCHSRSNLKEVAGKEGEGGSVKATYAAIRRYDGATDTKEVARQVEERFLPILSEMLGFVAYYVVDAGDGVMVSTSVFEHQAAEEQSSWRAGEFVAQYIAPLAPNPPQITAGDVVVAHKSS